LVGGFGLVLLRVSSFFFFFSSSSSSYYYCSTTTTTTSSDYQNQPYTTKIYAFLYARKMSELVYLFYVWGGCVCGIVTAFTTIGYRIYLPGDRG